ncbi:zinc metalloproteinase nas-13-like [Haliotis cracherodii]|uniref:zinc metalloproteinase nas-13-like n=1 Tax=Haliotis cracherodii TaxID=6455 RepID=UPI0039EABAA2
MMIFSMASTKFASFLAVISFIQILSSVSSLTMDQIIQNAANSSAQFEFMDEANGVVQVELDMKFTLEQWRDLIKLNKTSGNSREKRKAVRNARLRWTSKAIPYEIAPNTFNTREQQQIRNAIDDWEMYTCITFRTSSTGNRVRFQDGGGCSSFVGMLGRGSQAITLARGCRQKGTIIHEIGHAVGFHHEQTRPDRDRFVRILRENIPPNVFFNFQKYSTSVIDDFGVPYDFSSIMHYGSTAFTVNGRRTIETLDPQFQNRIGNRRGHSFRDIKLANKMYSCSESCTGITDADCPSSREGFVGKDCKCWCRGTGNSPVQLCDGGSIGNGGDGGDGGDGGSVTQAPVTGTCVNMNANCEAWAGRGECQRNPSYMTVYCQKACNVCDKVATCEDMNTNCDFWQGRGYCTDMFVNYMRENCAQSCGYCRSDESGYNGQPSLHLGTSIFTIVTSGLAVLVSFRH